MPLHMHLPQHFFSSFLKTRILLWNQAVTGKRRPEHGRQESDLLLVLCTYLRAEGFGKGGQAGLQGTDVANRQKAGIKHSRGAGNILIACTLEEVCCCPIVLHSHVPPLPDPAALPRRWQVPPPPRGARSPQPTSEALKHKWQWAW